jgi:hypothetical protein
MDFELTEKQKLVRASVRQSMLDEIAPDTERIDRVACRSNCAAAAKLVNSAGSPTKGWRWQ